jgi:hypothetical protein
MDPLYKVERLIDIVRVNILVMINNTDRQTHRQTDRQRAEFEFSAFDPGLSW